VTAAGETARLAGSAAWPLPVLQRRRTTAAQGNTATLLGKSFHGVREQQWLKRCPDEEGIETV
jgi:hypothetical protein